MLGNEAKVVLRNLAGRLAEKSGKRIPTSQMSQHPQWEDGVGLSLFYYVLGGQQLYLKIERQVSRSKQRLRRKPG